MKNNIILFYKKQSLITKLIIPSIVAVLLGIIFTIAIIKQVQVIRINTTALQKEIIPALEKATTNILIIENISETLTFAVIVSELDILNNIKSNYIIEKNLSNIKSMKSMTFPNLDKYLISFKKYFKTAIKQSYKIINSSSEDIGDSKDLDDLLKLYKEVKNNFLVLKSNMEKEIFLRTSLIKKTSIQIIYFIISYILAFILIMAFLSFNIYSDFNKRLKNLGEKLTQLDIKKVINKKTNIDELDILSHNIDKTLSNFNKLEKEKEQIEEFSQKDQLTKLYNRHYLSKMFDQFLEKNIHYGIILLDIDHFKRVNDTYGHQAGDKVLVKFAKILQQKTREFDIVSRWGGEEFLIIILNVSVDTLFSIAQKIRKTIEAETFDEVGKITASFGISLRNEGVSSTDTIELADKALYDAKKFGRNMVKISRK